jgi:hypothetical protein
MNGVGYLVSNQGDGENAVLVLHEMPDTSSIRRHLLPEPLRADIV